MIEVTAGRLAADLEREVLLQEGQKHQQLRRQLRQAAAWQIDRLPNIHPLLDDWQLAGTTESAGEICSSFHDWFVLPDGRLALLAADAEGDSLQAGFTAAAVHSAVKSHTNYRHSSKQLVGRVSETIWSSGPGDQTARLAYALIDPESGHLECSIAGQMTMVVVRGSRFKVFPAQAPQVGCGPDHDYAATRLTLHRGDILVMANDQSADPDDRQPRRRHAAGLAKTAARHSRASAPEIVTRISQRAAKMVNERERDCDRTILVLRRLSDGSAS